MSEIFLLIVLVIFASALVGLYVVGKWIYMKLQNQDTEVSDEVPDGLENTLEGVEMNKIDFKNSLVVRFAMIGLIALAVLIPLGNIRSIVKERSHLYDSVLSNIASQWGQPQKIVGPALVIPIVEKYDTIETSKTAKGETKSINKVVRKNKNIILLPKQLKTQIGLKEHYRYRGIYKSLVYGASIGIQGAFEIPDIAKMSDHLESVRYDKAYVIMSLSDTKTIGKVSALSFADQSSVFEPGVPVSLKGMSSGFHAPLRIDQNVTSYPFHFQLHANGSSTIRFSAFGEQSVIDVNSTWQHPSFQGDILPTSRTITSQGFHAKWVIPSLARSFPQAWIHEDRSYALNQLLTGVDLFEPIALYSLITRSIKYGVLFILLTFLTFSIFELTQKGKLHYVQYVLVGLSLGLFFLLLLSLSEHMTFLGAYLIASAITVISISLYVWFANRNLRHAGMIFLLLAALYAILYSLLQMEDYALLMGTGLLLFVLLVLMWITRNMRAGAGLPTSPDIHTES